MENMQTIKSQQLNRQVQSSGIDYSELVYGVQSTGIHILSEPVLVSLRVLIKDVSSEEGGPEKPQAI